MLTLCSLFDESPFILSVVGEHFCSEWPFAGAPRRNVILFGHRFYATTKQDNALRCSGAVCRESQEKTGQVRLIPLTERYCRERPSLNPFYVQSVDAFVTIRFPRRFSSPERYHLWDRRFRRANAGALRRGLAGSDL